MAIVGQSPQVLITLSQSLNLVLVIATIFCLAADVAMNLKQVEEWKSGITSKISLHKLGWITYKPGYQKRLLTFLSTR